MRVMSWGKTMISPASSYKAGYGEWTSSSLANSSSVCCRKRAYVNQGGSPWGNSNVMAKVMGIVKTNTSVYPEQRGNGYCARLETHIESVKVLGMVNITVLASGSMFLGDMKEPITGTKDGEKALNSGLPFTSRPKAVRYDYKVQMSGQPNRIRQTGFSMASPKSIKQWGSASGVPMPGSNTGATRF